MAEINQSKRRAISAISVPFPALVDFHFEDMGLLVGSNVPVFGLVAACAFACAAAAAVRSAVPSFVVAAEAACHYFPVHVHRVGRLDPVDATRRVIRGERPSVLGLVALPRPTHTAQPAPPMPNGKLALRAD